MDRLSGYLYDAKLSERSLPAFLHVSRRRNDRITNTANWAAERCVHQIGTDAAREVSFVYLTRTGSKRLRYENRFPKFARMSACFTSRQCLSAI